MKHLFVNWGVLITWLKEKNYKGKTVLTIWGSDLSTTASYMYPHHKKENFYN